MNEELKDKIIKCLDELQFLDILGKDISDLVEDYADEIEANAEEFERACE